MSNGNLAAALGGALALCALAVAKAERKTLLELPVSAVGNTAYLTAMGDRPWWNADWKRRAPLLVSSASDVAMGKAIVDVIVDFGEKINPDEVRVVTPWETEVPCVCEAKEGTRVELIFMTALRIHENKPFLVYWGNGKAKKPQHFPTMSLLCDDKDIRMANGLVDVTFDNAHCLDGLIRSLRIVGSEAMSELTTRTTGYAWEGFALRAGARPVWSKGVVTADNALKKAVRFDSADMSVEFALYAGQPRVDYRYELKGVARSLRVRIGWSCGGDLANDDIVYAGSSGGLLTARAALDQETDCLPHPSYERLGDYFSEGWYAISDRKVRDVVGMVFDRATLTDLSYSGMMSESVNMSFTHAEPSKDGSSPLVGSGALVALMGNVRDIRNEYLRLKGRPRVVIGRSEGVRAVPVRIPRLDHDFIADVNCGPGGNGGASDSSRPLDGVDWAGNIMNHLRAFGANSIRICGVGITGKVPTAVPKDLYERCVASYPEGRGRQQGVPEWSETAFDGRNLRAMTTAAHARGMSVNIWGGYMDGFRPRSGDRLDSEDIKADIELQNLYPKFGVDGVSNARAMGEGPGVVVSSGLQKKFGRNFLQWADKAPFFAAQDRNTELVKEFYRESKRRNPDVPVVMWNSECGEAGREMFMGDQAGYFDTCMVEVLANAGFTHVKGVGRRLRALFDNEPGRTIHDHYYFYNPDCFERIRQIEWPFACGLNGFSHENVVYERFTPEAIEIGADLYRFLGYTGLGDKVARMAPVKNLVVFRDSSAYRREVMAGEYGGRYGAKAKTDWRIFELGKLRNYPIDVVINRYFNAKALAKYRVVYVPDDLDFTADYAKELVAFVKAGGGAILDGSTKMCGDLEALGLKDGEIRSLGKGKIVWFKEVLSDAIGRNGQRFMQMVESLGGKSFYTIESDVLDSVLQGSVKGMFLAVYNPLGITARGRLRLATSKTPYILDVKSGVRSVYTNGYEIAVGAGQLGYYLIGGGDFTAIPETTPCAWVGAAAEALRPVGAKTTVTADPAFTQAVGIELAELSNGRHPVFGCSEDAKVECVRISPQEYRQKEFAKNLARATYLHIRGNAGRSGDVVFAECAEELTALLKRGGAIFFDQAATGPAARKFLTSVGVADPYATAVKSSKSGGGAILDAKLPEGYLQTSSKENVFGTKWSRVSFRRTFPKWDAKMQQAPVRARLAPDEAVLVLQNKVLGAGKIAFSENDAAFTDFYENRVYSNDLLSWLIGQPVGQHRDKVERRNGGPGSPVVL